MNFYVYSYINYEVMPYLVDSVTAERRVYDLLLKPIATTLLCFKNDPLDATGQLLPTLPVDIHCVIAEMQLKQIITTLSGGLVEMRDIGELIKRHARFILANEIPEFFFHDENRNNFRRATSYRLLTPSETSFEMLRLDEYPYDFGCRFNSRYEADCNKRLFVENLKIWIYRQYLLEHLRQRDEDEIKELIDSETKQMRKHLDVMRVFMECGVVHAKANIDFVPTIFDVRSKIPLCMITRDVHRFIDRNNLTVFCDRIHVEYYHNIPASHSDDADNDEFCEFYSTLR